MSSPTNPQKSLTREQPSSSTPFPIKPQQILEFLNKSKQVMTALYTDIMRDQEKKNFVLNVVKAAATSALAKKHMNSSGLEVTTHRPSDAVLNTATHTLTVNHHTYSESKLRRILSGLLVIIALAAGVSGLIINQERIKTWVNHLSFESVLEMLNAIVKSMLQGLATMHTSASKALEQLLKKTKL